MIDNALSSAMQSVVGAAIAKPPKNAEREVNLMMANVRSYFKRFCLYHLHNEFGLWLGRDQPGSPIEHCAGRVTHLLAGFEFLRDNPSQPFFSSRFFEHFMLNILTLSPFNLCSFIGVDHLDNLFTLGGAAIIAALHDFEEGFCVPRDVKCDVWRMYYLEVEKVIRGMRQEDYLRQWLDDFQKNLLDRGRASLPPHD